MKKSTEIVVHYVLAGACLSLVAVYTALTHLARLEPYGVDMVDIPWNEAGDQVIRVPRSVYPVMMALNDAIVYLFDLGDRHAIVGFTNNAEPIEGTGIGE